MRSVVRRRLPIMVLILSFSSATSAARLDLNRSRQVTLSPRSPLRRWRDLGGEVAPAGSRVPVKSFQVPDRARHVGLAAKPPSTPDFARHRRHLVAKVAKVAVMLLMVSPARHFALD